MIKILKNYKLLSFILFLIVAILVLTQKSCKQRKANSKLDDRLTSDSSSSSIEFDIKNLDIKINELNNSKYISISTMPTNEYVKGYSGYYWTMDMKDSVAQSILLFPAGEYTYQDNDWKVTASLNYIYSKVLEGVVKNLKYKVFLEGQADLSGDRSFTRKFAKGYVFDSIDYFPTYKSKASSAFMYDCVAVKKILYEDLKNGDLPLLRASYLNKKLSYFPRIAKPILLEGEVKNSIGPDYRNGKIILFVDTTGFQK